MVKAGKNIKATLIDAGLQEDKHGETQPYLKFRTADGEITWFGSLKSEKAEEFSVKQLLRAGFAGVDFDDLKKPFTSVFEPIPLVITVQEQEYEGKKSLKLTFVNPEKKEFTGSAPKKAAVFAKYRKELGVKPKLEEDSPF